MSEDAVSFEGRGGKMITLVCLLAALFGLFVLIVGVLAGSAGMLVTGIIIGAPAGHCLLRALTPKRFLITGVGVEYRERERIRFKASWSSIVSVASIRESEGSDSVKITTEDGYHYWYVDEDFSEEMLKEVFLVLMERAKGLSHIEVEDGMRWSWTEEEREEYRKKMAGRGHRVKKKKKIK